MAQSGYTPISLYYTTTASTAPTSGNLVNGELAINITDGKLYYKDNSGVVQLLATKGGVGASSTTQLLFNSSGAVTGSSSLTWDGAQVSITGGLTVTGTVAGAGFSNYLASPPAIGGTSAAAATFTNLTFSGTARRITGDFSNSTLANRVSFQTSTASSQTTLGIIPSSGGNAGRIAVYSSSDPDNATFAHLQSTPGTNHLYFGKLGTGTWGPLIINSASSFGGNVGEMARFGDGNTADVTLGGDTGNKSFRAVGTTLATPNNRWIDAIGGISGSSTVPTIASNGATLDTNVGLQLVTKGTGSLAFITDYFGTPRTQLQVTHTAGATNYVTVTGSSTNPKIASSGGLLQLQDGSNQVAIQATTANANALDLVARSSDNNSVLRFMNNAQTVVNVALSSVPGFGLFVTTASTGADAGYPVCFQHVASAGRYLQFYGSVSGNPKISASGGSVDLGGSGGSVAFFGGTGGTKPTITGSRSANAALASLLTQLATLGLVTDSTTV